MKSDPSFVSQPYTRKAHQFLVKCCQKMKKGTKAVRQGDENSGRQNAWTKSLVISNYTDLISFHSLMPRWLRVFCKCKWFSFPLCWIRPIVHDRNWNLSSGLAKCPPSWWVGNQWLVCCRSCWWKWWRKNCRVPDLQRYTTQCEDLFIYNVYMPVFLPSILRSLVDNNDIKKIRYNNAKK